MDFPAILRQLLAFVGARHPLHILCAVSAGIVLDALVQALAAETPVPWLLAFAEYGVYWTIPLCILVAAGFLVLSGKRLSEKTLAEFDLIERILDKGELTQAEKQMAWRNVLQKSVEAFDPASERGMDPGRIAQQTIDETKAEE